jgi:hypothetical protein
MNLDGMKRDCLEAIRKHRGDGYAEMCLRVIDQCQAYQQQLADTKTQLEKAEELGRRGAGSGLGLDATPVTDRAEPLRRRARGK